MKFLATCQGLNAPRARVRATLLSTAGAGSVDAEAECTFVKDARNPVQQTVGI